MKQQIIDFNVFWLREVWKVHGTLFVHGDHDVPVGVLLNKPVHSLGGIQFWG
ncbi:hypothetical protein NVP1181O_24 [Vibrio phage 1.181.O._10N.286.46.C9]|nr:hypothetical protein NVP1181O_24 [Vibrio phage 1.181.O._10N.286.46.C9]